MQAHPASSVHAAFHAGTDNRAGHFHGEIKDLPKLRVRMDKLALSYQAQYGFDVEHAFNEMVQERLDGDDSGEMTPEYAADLVLLNTEGLDERERHVRAYGIAKRRYYAAEQRAHQGSLFEVAALAPQSQGKEDWYDDVIARARATEKRMTAEKEARRIAAKKKSDEEYRARIDARTQAKRAATMQQRRDSGQEATSPSAMSTKLAYRTNELEPGLRAWTMIGEDLVEVEVVVVREGRSAGKQKTAIVKRVDNSTVLPKARTAAALRRREAKHGYDPGPARPAAPLPRPSEVAVVLRPGAVPAPHYDLYEHVPTDVSIHNPQGSSWTAYLAGECPGRGRPVASATTAKGVEQLLRALGPVGAIGYRSLKAQAHAATEAIRIVPHPAHPTGVEVKGEGHATYWRPVGRGDFTLASPDFRRELEVPVPAPADACELPSDGMAKRTVEAYVVRFQNARGKVPHLIVGNQGVDGAWMVRNADDMSSVASFHSLECAEAAVRPTRGRANEPVEAPSATTLAAAPGLHERVAKLLGWTVAETQSFSLPALRDLVRPVSPKVAAEMDQLIRGGGYIVGGIEQKHEPVARLPHNWANWDHFEQSHKSTFIQWAEPAPDDPSESRYAIMRSESGPGGHLVWTRVSPNPDAPTQRSSGGFYDIPEEGKEALRWAIESAHAHKEEKRRLIQRPKSPERSQREKDIEENKDVYVGEAHIKLPKWWAEGVRVRVKATPWLRKNGLRVHGGAKGDDRAWPTGTMKISDEDVGVIAKNHGAAGWDWKIEFSRGRTSNVDAETPSQLLRADAIVADEAATPQASAIPAIPPSTSHLALVGPNEYSHSPKPAARWLQKLYDTSFAHGEDLRNFIQDETHGKRFSDSSDSDRELAWILKKDWATSTGANPSRDARFFGMGGSSAKQTRSAGFEAYATAHGYTPNRMHEKAVREFILAQLGSAEATVRDPSIIGKETVSTPRVAIDYEIREEAEPYSKTGIVWRAYNMTSDAPVHAAEETREGIEKRLRENGPVGTITWIPAKKEEPAPTPAPKAVKPVSALRVHAALNPKEAQVHAALADGHRFSIGQLARIFRVGSVSEAQANSWVRNSLRKLLALGLAHRVADGVYELTR